MVPYWQEQLKWLTVVVVVLQLSINRDVLNADTASRRYGWWFQVKGEKKGTIWFYCCCNNPSNIKNYCLDFISKPKVSPQNKAKLYKRINTLNLMWVRTHTPLVSYFKCINPYRLDLIAKTLFDSFTREIYAINVICTWASTIHIFPWYFIDTIFR